MADYRLNHTFNFHNFDGKTLKNSFIIFRSNIYRKFRCVFNITKTVTWPQRRKNYYYISLSQKLFFKKKKQKYINLFLST